MANAYADLSGIFYVQQQYLADLSAISTKDTGVPALKYMDELRKDLTTAYKTYQDASPSANAVLDRQANMKQIIENEVVRLDNKKTSVDAALYGQKRMAQFSDSYSKKYFAQIKILFIIIIVLIIYLGLTFLNSLIPVPDAIFMFIMIVVGGFALFIVLLTMRDINSRYNMDFDKLNLSAPSRININGNVDGNLNAGGIGGLLCVGESCCPAGNTSGAIWDSKTQQCLSFNVGVATKSGFTLMSQASVLEPSSNTNGQVKPYEPCEINSYTKI
jgi:hypothetical protein